MPVILKILSGLHTREHAHLYTHALAHIRIKKERERKNMEKNRSLNLPQKNYSRPYIFTTSSDDLHIYEGLRNAGMYMAGKN